MSNFLKTLTAFGMEGMNSEEVIVEAYANSECAEERIEIDNLEATEASMESMSDAIMEEGLGMQSLALEAAGFDFETASGFTGELSTEAVGNMVKRGYYEVKIQVKKAAQKVWKMIISFIESLMGSEGRLKSYGKLFKKYRERLAKINPKDTKDGEEREVTIRKWKEANVVANLQNFKELASPSVYAEIRNIVKAINPEEIAKKAIDFVNGVQAQLDKALSKVGAKANQSTALSKGVTAAITKFSKAELEKLERVLEEKLKDSDVKERINEWVEAIKEVDSDEMSILTAKAELLEIAAQLESECNKDVKFKAELIKLKKAWDKKFGSWDLKSVDATTDAEKDARDAAAAFLRMANKLSSAITALRLGISKVYSANASNMQGVLADMAKVISKGTNIGA